MKTCELVKELVKRDAVEEIIVEPYDEFEIKVKGQPVQTTVKAGPATIIIVWD